MLTEEERHQLLIEWNDTSRPYPSESCIHELIEAQVEELEQVCARIAADGIKDGAEWIEQLRTALKVFASRS